MNLLIFSSRNHKINSAFFCKNLVFVGSTFLLLFLSSLLKAQSTFPVNGVADEKHIAYAFTNAVIFVDYQTRIDSAILILRNGKIEAIGKNVQIPLGAIVQDLKGKYMYPSFIDVYSSYGLPEIKKERRENRGPNFVSNRSGALGWNDAIRAELKAIDLFNSNKKQADELRKIGFGTVVSHIQDGIARGTGAAFLLGDDQENKLVLSEKTSAHYSFDKGNSNQDYPSSLMGAIALLRQTYYDAQWYAAGGNKKEINQTLSNWNAIQTLPQIFDAGDKNSMLRAAKLGSDIGVQYILKSNGDEYQRIDEIKATKSSVIVPIAFPQPFEVEDPYEAMQMSLGEMKHWDLAPGNLAALEQAEIQFAITLADLKDKKDFMKNMRKAIERGLSETAALKALTHTPAELLGLNNKTGSLKVGMLANFIICSQGIFSKENVLYENWVAGNQYILNDVNQKDVRGKYELQIGKLSSLTLISGGEFEKPTLVVNEDTVKIKGSLNQVFISIAFAFELIKSEQPGLYRFSGNVLENGDWRGKAELPDGTWSDWTAKKTGPHVPEAKKDSVSKPKAIPTQLTFPNKAYGWKNLPTQKAYLIKNASVWTNEEEGILKNTDVLFVDGKIKQIGKNLDSSLVKDLVIIDGTGKHFTAGIIDEHSHIAISRGVNEGTQAVTSEVRIGDVVNPDDVNIYRNLSGGVTSSQLLHGSANPIGGQSQLIKLRWGSSAEKMKFEGWPGFIKFALGENVKQSNWGDNQRSRFPQTRMGVEQVFVDAFIRAKEYEAEQKNFASKKSEIPVRRDLELDALVEIMNEKRFITCHSYVQSEINMLMHVGDSLGFRVNTFTHILEGYKVADKMKKHGAGASTFSDWWAYKFEVLEAIPHNGAILNEMGVVTAFNSDDAEMARRLNQEAAKAVKYGEVSEEDAWKFVTLNPAKLLHIDDKVGSIKVGKDADLVLWNDNPLSIYAKAEKTFVDGILYFDLEQDVKLREEIRTEKASLIKKMMDAKKAGEKSQKAAKKNEDELYTCDTLLEDY